MTQKDVAALAGVSRTTVSYVLDPDGSTKVHISAETREKVLAAARRLGYHPDANAQSLRSGKARTIGVLLPDMRNPHFWQLLAGIEQEAHIRRHAILIFHTALAQEEEDVGLRELSRRRIDGAILISSYPPYPESATRRLKQSHRCIVDLSFSESSPFDRVSADYRSATADLMDHLFSLGHRRIGFVFGVASAELGTDRLLPYRKSLARHGVRAERSLLVRCGPTIEEGYDAACRLLRRADRPSAIIAINDYIATAVVRAASDLGIAVPGELSVAGFDDVPMSRFIVPRLTTVHRESEEIGASAVRMLLDRIDDPDGRKRVEYVPSSLVVRESTGPA